MWLLVPRGVSSGLMTQWDQRWSNTCAHFSTCVSRIAALWPWFSAEEHEAEEVRVVPNLPPRDIFLSSFWLPSVKLDGGSSQGKDKGKRGCRRDVCWRVPDYSKEDQKDLMERWLPTPVFLPVEFHGQRSLWAIVQGVAENQTWLRD